MINYCEESEESSSTDEEDLCKPRVTLRRRDNKVNYNESALAAGEKAETPPEPKPRWVLQTVLIVVADLELISFV